MTSMLPSPSRSPTRTSSMSFLALPSMSASGGSQLHLREPSLLSAYNVGLEPAMISVFPSPSRSPEATAVTHPTVGNVHIRPPLPDRSCTDAGCVFCTLQDLLCVLTVRW